MGVERCKNGGESALRSAETLLSRVQAQPLAFWPDGGPESLRSPCCKLDIHKNQIKLQNTILSKTDTLDNVSRKKCDDKRSRPFRSARACWDEAEGGDLQDEEEELDDVLEN
ncbi:hypothetical protein PoB_000949100 [Plakobranchus ocellatus]|uniref:Uncharacterized protein n=1 Tax=Plakobranchus ocellatus TaxID=259542 RepID=A0AAV3Y6V6_9GAST|nr:hypothetical protein PoB_000949100 [Plakobranchus ocellatus]